MSMTISKKLISHDHAFVLLGLSHWTIMETENLGLHFEHELGEISYFSMTFQVFVIFHDFPHNENIPYHSWLSLKASNWQHELHEARLSHIHQKLSNKK